MHSKLLVSALVLAALGSTMIASAQPSPLRAREARATSVPVPRIQDESKDGMTTGAGTRARTIMPAVTAAANNGSSLESGCTPSLKEGLGAIQSPFFLPTI
jgi:hypothetical protein